MSNKYEDFNAVVEAIFTTYVHCAQQAGAIRTPKYSESIFAEDEEIASGQPKVVQYQDKSLPKINAFLAKEFIADADSVFDEVLKFRPSLEPVLDAILHETAGLPHDKIDSKKRSALVLYIGRLAAQINLNPATYFVHRRVKVPR